jgi:hypothetical protein
MTPIPRERLRHLASGLHRLGARGLYEFLREIEGGADLRERLERYVRLERDYGDFVRAMGGDRLQPPTVIVGFDAPRDRGVSRDRDDAA